jgi:V-type H+-transporting ATPase subunit G
MQHSKGNQQQEDEANKEADKQIQAIKDAGKKSQAGVVQNLLKAVLEPTPAAQKA